MSGRGELPAGYEVRPVACALPGKTWAAMRGEGTVSRHASYDEAAIACRTHAVWYKPGVDAPLAGDASPRVDPKTTASRPEEQDAAPVQAETFAIAHDGFNGTLQGRYTTREGKRGVVLQQVGTRVVHVYGEKWLASPPSAGEAKTVEPVAFDWRAFASWWEKNGAPHGRTLASKAWFAASAAERADHEALRAENERLTRERDAMLDRALIAEAALSVESGSKEGVSYLAEKLGEYVAKVDTAERERDEARARIVELEAIEKTLRWSVTDSEALLADAEGRIAAAAEVIRPFATTYEQRVPCVADEPTSMHFSVYLPLGAFDAARNFLWAADPSQSSASDEGDGA